MNQKHCVTMYSGCFLLIKVLAVMLFVFFFDCKSFTLVIVAHFSSLYRSYSLFSNMMPWHLSMCQVIWNTHFGESKLTKLTCFLLKISWNYFLLYTRWEWISMFNLQERENEFSVLKSLYITIINTPQGYPKVKELYHKGFSLLLVINFIIFISLILFFI